jgi:hypothetical protein
MTYFVLLCLVIFIYAVIVARFRQSRKRLVFEKKAGHYYSTIKVSNEVGEVYKITKTIQFLVSLMKEYISLDLEMIPIGLLAVIQKSQEKEDPVQW